MARVNFERVDTRMNPHGRRMFRQESLARCDLARPAAEIAAIALLLKSLDWTGEAFEQDGVLHVEIDHDKSWLIQERALHAALSIARKLVAKAVESLKENEIPEVAEPEIVEETIVFHRGSRAYLMENLSAIVPEGNYDPSFLISIDENKKLTGYFITSSDHDQERKDLASALLGMLFPGHGIAAKTPEFRSVGHVVMDKAPERIRDYAAACYKVTYWLLNQFKKEVSELQWNGKPSVFTDEDNDARDWLLREMQAGARIKRTPIQDAEYNDVDGVYRYELDDGTELAHTIVMRLVNSNAIKAEGWPYRHDRKDDELPDLVLDSRITQAVIEPRTNSVPFQAFQSYCAYRRYPEDSSDRCAHRKGRGECSLQSCPIASQIYHQDVGYYSSGFEDDPAFDEYDWERDAFCYAIHPNTERSYAWKAAGAYAVNAIVNQMIRDTYELNITRRLYGKENLHAVKQAINDGWIEVDEQLGDLGVVVKLTEKTITAVNDQIAERQKTAAA